MKYYSNLHKCPPVSLQTAVIEGLAPDGGLYMPERIETLTGDFFARVDGMTFTEIALEVAKCLFIDDDRDIDPADLKKIVEETLAFPTPVVKVTENIYSLELFHGPTFAFKDVGARFMARLLAYCLRGENRQVNVLVATSGDTGSAVAQGFWNVEGVRVWVLYPKNRVSSTQECQFATLGNNIHAIEIDGTFDDCQSLVKQAFSDSELKKRMQLSSANSINIARLLPQTFYYFNAFAQMRRQTEADNIVVSVPSGNLGNLTAALIAKRMGLPIKRLVAANNSNNLFFRYLQTNRMEIFPAVATLANAMDVACPSNLARILDLYAHRLSAIRQDIAADWFSDEQIASSIVNTLALYDYLPCPHGACALMALQNQMKAGETGIFLQTAHPAKFADRLEPILHRTLTIPPALMESMKRKKLNIQLTANYTDFRELLCDSTG